MQRGAVPLMPAECVAGKQAVIELHETVADDFGDDGSAADGVTALVALEDRPAWKGECGSVRSINKHEVWRAAQPLDGVRHGRQGGLEDTFQDRCQVEICVRSSLFLCT